MLKNADDAETRISLEKAAYVATFYLINGPGYPISWNSTNVHVIGLASDLNAINGKKFIELMKIDNASLSTFLGAPEFKFSVNLTKIDDTPINSTGYFTQNPNISARILSYVSFNNTLSKLYVTVWK